MVKQLVKMVGTEVTAEQAAAVVAAVLLPVELVCLF
jgi:hypothetical protein